MLNHYIGFPSTRSTYILESREDSYIMEAFAYSQSRQKVA